VGTTRHKIETNKIKMKPKLKEENPEIIGLSRLVNVDIV